MSIYLYEYHSLFGIIKEKYMKDGTIMNFRQIHLDFHTSEKIPDIGAKFSKEQFQKMLKKGHVNSITVFSKCHHGWAYHPSKANEQHPNLKFDLLGAQIDAAHEIGVKTPVYISAGLDEKMARRHPEWLIRNKDETTTWVPDFTQPGYHRHCFNSPYLDYLLAQIKEVCENYDADGIFLDIVGVYPCYCQNCINTLIAEGKDPYDEKNIWELGERVYMNYLKRVRETIDSVKPGLPVFHNGGHIRAGRRDLARMNTHLELESLPTGGWGYDHFPLSAAYVRTLGMEFLGMTGKFHQSWGEFGGYKHPNALKYEAALSGANGAKCSIGDQLHPSGEMDEATYTLIGEGYKYLEDREKWLDGAKNISDIAVFSNEAIDNYFHSSKSALVGNADAGCARILLEGKYLFDYVDSEEDISKYKLLILPDNIKLDQKLAEKIKAFMNNGGKVLASGKSGLNFDETEFMLDFGCEYKGKSEYVPSYLRNKFDIKSLVNGAYVIYSESEHIEAAAGEELSIIEKPYFNRDVMHFCSHRHTPTSGEKYSTAAVKNGNAIYIAYNIFSEYADVGSIFVKESVIHLIEMLIGDEKTIKTNLPAQGIVTLTEQNGSKLVHLLYASPVKRGKDVEIIEDLIPIYNTTVKVKCATAPKKVTLVPEMTEIPFEYNGESVEFSVEKFECWQIVELGF